MYSLIRNQNNLDDAILYHLDHGGLCVFTQICKHGFDNVFAKSTRKI